MSRRPTSGSDPAPARRALIGLCCLALTACSASPPATPNLRTGDVVATIDVGGSPGRPVVAGGLVWVPDVNRGGLIVIDPRTNRVIRRVAVGDRGRLLAAGCAAYTVHQLTPESFLVRTCDLPIALAAGAGTLWVLRNDVHALERLDPRDGRSLGLVPLGIDPWDLAAKADQVWITDYASGAVVRVDPASGGVVATLREPLPGESGVAAGEGAVWVADSRHGVLLRIDPARNAVVDRIPLLSTSSRPLPVLVAFGSVWVRLETAQRVLRLDPGSGRVVATIPVGFFYGRDGEDQLAADASGVWVSGLEVAHIGAASNRVDRRLPFSAATLGVGLGSLWAMDLGGPLRRVAL